MAIPSISTTTRTKLVYTGDPAFGRPLDDHGSWTCRAATAADAQIGASIIVIRPLSRPERREARLAGQGNFTVECEECGQRGFLGYEGDVRPLADVWDSMPDRVRVSIGSAVQLITGLPIDPFAPRSSG
jgi:hypothetical protein